jgi:predicted branched-subunit amino acid permease
MSAHPPLARSASCGYARFMDETSNAGAAGSAWGWYGRGLACLFSIPALILMFAFAGFAGFAQEAGFALSHSLLMVATIWALPSKVVLVGAVLSKSGLLATAIAVGLSSVRLMPMTMAIIPEMRASGTRRLTLYVLSHFIAVTAWVMALERFRHVPRERRTAFFAGLATVLLVSSMAVVTLTYSAAGALPPIMAAALVFVTPLYFLFSLWGSARERASHYAMVTGLALTPLFHWLLPQADILATGVIGGVAAYALTERGKARP